MAENWTAIASEVASALGEVGFTAQIRRATNTIGPNDWTPGVPVITNTDVTILSGMFDFGQIDGTLIRATDRKLTVEAGKIVPTPDDVMVIDGKEHEIIMVKPLDPGGIAVLYEIQVRS